MMDCEWIIIGSGPSGCTAAMTLHELGIKDVVVLERLSEEPHRRYHSICGEAVSDRMFGLIGYRPPSEIVRIDSIAVDFSDSASIRIPVKGSIIDRNEMLADLRSKSSARFIKGTVTEVEVDGSGRYLVHTSDETYRCRYLIGADGACSTVRRDIFGSKPSEMVPIVNNVVPGEAEKSVLRFIVAARYKGGYRWEFPSNPGTMSVGFIKGTDSVDEPISTGARMMSIGKLPSITKGNTCCLIGDAACLGNPLCFGGIGVGMLSARKAVECMVKGDLSPYQNWVNKDRMFDEHFMKAHRTFLEWSDDDIVDAMRPFRKGYSMMRGFLACLRRPSMANVYVSCWVGFSKGW